MWVILLPPSLRRRLPSTYLARQSWQAKRVTPAALRRGLVTHHEMARPGTQACILQPSPSSFPTPTLRHAVERSTLLSPKASWVSGWRTARVGKLDFNPQERLAKRLNMASMRSCDIVLDGPHEGQDVRQSWMHGGLKRACLLVR